jgi:hypothetical protein
VTLPPAAGAAAADRAFPAGGAVPARSRPRRPVPPRRISGPAPTASSRELRSPASARGSARAHRGLVVWLRDLCERVANHRLLDRLVAGKVWIGLVAFALIGIVTLQLGLLELNASIGRLLERQGSLQRENAALSIESSEVAAGDRVESQAGKLGMVLVPAGTLRFLGPRPGDLTRATAALGTLGSGSGSGSAAGAGTAAGVQAATSQSAASSEASGASEATGASPAAQAAAPPPGEQPSAASAGSSAEGQASSGQTQSRAAGASPSRSEQAPSTPAASPGAASSPGAAGGSNAGSGSSGGEAGAGGGTGAGPSG